MDSDRSHLLRERLLPALFGLAALAALIGGALASTAGPAAAQSNCQYTSCTTSASPGVPPWVWASIAAIVIAALIAAVLIFQHERRRRQPPAGPAAEAEMEPEVTEAASLGGPSGPPPGASGIPTRAGSAVATGTAAGAGAVLARTSASGTSPEAAGLPDYVEGPDDVGGPAAVLPAPSPKKAAATATAAPAAAGEIEAGEEPNIDDLMDELDRISGEILKKDARPKGGSGSAGSTSKDAGESDASDDDA